MASSVFVLDSTLRRTQIKVTPGKYLREVLEEACKSRKLNPEEYTLKTQTNKIIDLSQPFRLSGLTAGAKLQLVQGSRSPSVVSIALQLPEEEGGTRLSDKFASNTSLWAVLRRFEEGVAGQSQKKLNITQQGVPSSSEGAGRLLYRQPCLNAIGRTLETFEDLQKSLAQLGLSSGSVLLRLSYKNTERPLEEAMSQISQYFTSGTAATVEETTGVSAAPSIADTPNVAPIAPEAPTAPSAEQKDEIMTDAEPTQPEVGPSESAVVAEKSTVSSTNGVTVFLPPSRNTPAAALHEEHESVYEPSVDDARAHQASLTKAGRNTRLLSDRELEEQEQEKQAKLSAVQKVDVRVRYPDQSMIESTFYTTETAADLYKKVRITLTHSVDPFELKYADNKGQQSLPDDASKRLIRDIGFRGKVLVTMLWGPDASTQARNEPPLLSVIRAEAQELKVNLQQHAEPSPPPPGPAKPAKDTKDTSTAGKGDLEAKMKKFLGFGKKK